jgi:hypothetical protein
MMRTRLLIYAPAVCALALVVAAWGSTGAPSGTVTNAGSPAPSGPSPALQFAKYMRANGEPDFPDPALGAPSTSAPTLDLRGMTFQFSPGLTPASPAFRHAASDCGLRLFVKMALG